MIIAHDCDFDGNPCCYKIVFSDLFTLTQGSQALCLIFYSTTVCSHESISPAEIIAGA